MSKGRRPKGARYWSGSNDRSLDPNIGSSRPRRVRRTGSVPAEEVAPPEEVVPVKEERRRPSRGMEDWPLSNIQEMIVAQEAKEAARKARVSELFGKGTCMSFLFGTKIRATPHKNAANSRWETAPVEGKEFLSQVVCPEKRSLRCAGCILNYLRDGEHAEVLRENFPAEVEVAIGMDLRPGGGRIEY